MVKKTLNEALAELDAGSKVAIGTEKGGGFIYIGTVEGAFKDVHRLFETDLNRQKYFMRKAFYMLDKYSFLPPEDGGILEYCKIISDNYKKYRVYRNKIDNFEDPMARQIKNMYQKEDGCLAIIVNGAEIGSVWLEEEYNDPFVNINLIDHYKI